MRQKFFKTISWSIMAGILRREDISTPIVSLIYDINGEVAAGVAGVDAVVSILISVIMFMFQSKR